MRSIAENMSELKKKEREREKLEAAFKIHEVSKKREKSGNIST